MKLSKFFSVVFAVFGGILMIGTVAVCLLCRDMEAQMTQLPQEAGICSEQFMEALDLGDYASAGAMIYGQPELGGSGQPQSAIGGLVWDAFLESFSYTFVGDIYAQGTEIYRDVTITALDISSVTEALPQLSREALARRTEEAGEDAAASLYDAAGMLRQEARDLILREAAAQAVTQGEMTTYEAKLHMVQQDGRWWAIPDQTLRTAISGGVS